MSRASALYRLQQIDTAADQARARLAEIEVELASDAALKSARTRAEETAAARRRSEADSKGAEDEVATQRRKLEETEARLYGGSVQNPKVLQELQAEAEALRRHLSTLEDRALESMAGLEQAEQEAEAATTALELAEADAAGRSQSLAKERRVLDDNLQRRATEREAAVAGVDAGDLRLYHSLREGGLALAVAEVQEGSCGACGLSLSASGRQEVRGAASLVRCLQCGRIQYSG